MINFSNQFHNYVSYEVQGQTVRAFVREFGIVQRWNSRFPVLGKWRPGLRETGKRFCPHCEGTPDTVWCGCQNVPYPRCPVLQARRLGDVVSAPHKHVKFPTRTHVFLIPPLVTVLQQQQVNAEEEESNLREMTENISTMERFVERQPNVKD
ncbi:hypothetical protein J6590_091273 [Homalodisca vitripennis]|nr:hypothetical protein J6590_091273 [Homalodisca vitripennis]